MVCRFRPPLFIIETIYKLVPFSVSERDCCGRCPVHIAAIHGASPDVTSYLVRKNMDVVDSMDEEGKTILHHLFQDYKQKFCNQKFHVFHRKKKGSKLMQELISFICEIAPDLTLKEDQNGMIPLEYAVDEEVDTKIMNTVQKSAAKVNHHYYQLLVLEKVFGQKPAERFEVCNAVKTPSTMDTFLNKAA